MKKIPLSMMFMMWFMMWFMRVELSEMSDSVEQVCCMVSSLVFYPIYLSIVFLPVLLQSTYFTLLPLPLRFDFIPLRPLPINMSYFILCVFPSPSKSSSDPRLGHSHQSHPRHLPLFPKNSRMTKNSLIESSEQTI